MKKINWQVRFRNPQFIGQIIVAIFVPIFTYFGITAADMTTWSALLTTIADAISNPYIVLTILVSVYNSINDPTVSGLFDSEQAMKYYRPKKEKY